MILILSDKNSNPALVTTYFSMLLFVDVSLEFYTYSQSDVVIEFNTKPGLSDTELSVKIELSSTLQGQRVPLSSFSTSNDGPVSVPAL